MGNISSYITPATQAAAGIEQGKAEDILQATRMKREASQASVAEKILALREQEAAAREGALQYITDAKGNLVGVPKFGARAGGGASTVPDGSAPGGGYDVNDPSQNIYADGSGPSVPPQTSGQAGGYARSALQPVQTGIKMPVKHGPTRVASAPDGRRMLEQQQPDGTWSPAMTAQGDTVFTPAASGRGGVNAKTPGERDRDTHLHVLNAQIQTTQEQINQLQKIVNGGQNPAAGPDAIKMGVIAGAKLEQLRARSDSLTSVRDNMATSLGPAGAAAPILQPGKPAPRGANYVAPPGKPPLTAAEQQKAMTDPDYRAFKETLGYKFLTPQR